MNDLRTAITNGVAQAVYKHRQPHAYRDSDLPTKRMSGLMPLSDEQGADLSKRIKLDRIATQLGRIQICAVILVLQMFVVIILLLSS